VDLELSEEREPGMERNGGNLVGAKGGHVCKRTVDNSTHLKKKLWEKNQKPPMVVQHMASSIIIGGWT